MRKTLPAAFGKLERDKDGHTTAWHPLTDHLIGDSDIDEPAEPPPIGQERTTRLER
ncbi:hypothetical protein [uncultured Lamprocystis sp.]|jgi:hypothetical protein|uniref:hypothetical protein n=1 Tax=uncultured Lamprocystis sp. TaxID=543132 RepID=UPI0025E4176D|nr:hypothetical protein [uncultured Lamprocystis sp.]